eukprot:3776723-Prymnesium_polylepis.1
MANTCLHATEPGICRSQGCRKGTHLSGVAKRRTGAMAFDGADAICASNQHGALNQTLLSSAIGCSEASTLAVLPQRTVERPHVTEASLAFASDNGSPHTFPSRVAIRPSIK